MEAEVILKQDPDERLKLQIIFRRCCSDAEWKYLMSCANFSRVFLQMERVEDFEAVCEAAANLLNVANVAGRAGETKQRLLECREKVEQELEREGMMRTAA